MVSAAVDVPTSGYGPGQTIDVSALPVDVFDWRSPVWWGNLLAILIETTTLALLVTSYFYLKRNFSEWPPPKVEVFPPIYRPVPELTWPTINLVLLVLSCVPMYLTDVAARRKNRMGTLLGLLVIFLVAVAATFIRFREFPGIHFKWNDNAYGSVVWWMLATHLTYILAAGAEFLILFFWVLTHKLDESHALDVTLGGGYWYWVAGTWVVVYVVVYWSARMMS